MSEKHTEYAFDKEIFYNIKRMWNEKLIKIMIN